MIQVSPKTEETTVDTPLASVALDVTGMKCAGCVQAVERQLVENPGVVAACVNLVTEIAVVRYVPGEIQPQTLAEKLTSGGFPSQLRSSTKEDGTEISPTTAERRQQEARQQSWNLAIAGILLIVSSLGHLNHIGGPSIPYFNNIWLHWALATLALIFPGRSLLMDGWRSLWQGFPNMNTLVGLGTFSAYLASCIALIFPQWRWECFFDEPVMLLGFILLGRTLEAKARLRARRALEALSALQPKVARIIGDDTSESGIEIPVEQVRLGERVWVLPGEKIPVDGEIVVGQTTIDESMLTGESIPVSKMTGETVTAGTLNQSGAIAIQTTRIGQDTTLAKIIASVEDAQTHKAPIQQLVDTIAGHFAYGVMAIALLTFLFWNFIGTKLYPEVLMVGMSHEGHQMSMWSSPLLLSLKLAIAVLVVACPCALGLATPTAILVGTGIGAERGLLIKGGDILEKVHQLKAIVFDKTGTLTIGHPLVTDCITIAEPETSSMVSKAREIEENRLLQIAASIERGTNHPLATAIIEAAQKRELTFLEATNFHTEAGLGISAVIDDEELLLGNETWLEQHKIVIEETIQVRSRALSQAGKTVVYLAIAGKIAGAIALQDPLRPDAQKTVKSLQKLGLQTILVTGDRAEVANAIAEQVGITEVFSSIRPNEKAEIIKALQAESTLSKHPTPQLIAMVGDGINDAPALAQADIGISLQGGTEVALETADIVLMKERLFDVVEAIRLSLATFNKIRQNLFWALGYNTFALPMAAGILLPRFGLLLSPALAAAFMAFSSVTVVTNSLLLRRQFKVQK
jgi:P-type Cu2+ transporter